MPSTCTRSEWGLCAIYVIVSIFQWKPFWLAIQRDPQNDWTATQNRVNNDVFAQAPSGQLTWFFFSLSTFFILHLTRDASVRAELHVRRWHYHNNIEHYHFGTWIVNSKWKWKWTWEICILELTKAQWRRYLIASPRWDDSTDWDLIWKASRCRTLDRLSYPLRKTLGWRSKRQAKNKLAGVCECFVSDWDLSESHCKRRAWKHDPNSSLRDGFRHRLTIKHAMTWQVLLLFMLLFVCLLGNYAQQAVKANLHRGTRCVNK